MVMNACFFIVFIVLIMIVLVVLLLRAIFISRSMLKMYHVSFDFQPIQSFERTQHQLKKKVT